MLTIVADANIPHAEAAFGALGTVTPLAGSAITREALRDVDVLVVRSVTRVGADLVDGTPVQFVATATAGVDHVDVEALRQRGIAFASAPGSNAASVVDYVLAALLALAADRGETLRGRTLGVVGAGEVGGRLVPRARALGLRVVVSDPPRATAGLDDHHYLSLDDLLRQSDVVTLHTPLTRAPESSWPTAGMIDADALGRMRPGAWLINAARGEVADGPALLGARRSGHLGALVLDVWPEEPVPDPALVEVTDLATPHIAGYAADAKTRGTAMIAAALVRWAEGQGIASPTWRPPPVSEIGLDAPPLDLAPDAWLDALIRQAYDVRADDSRFRAALLDRSGDARAAAFSALRKGYPERFELSRYSVRGRTPDGLTDAIGVGLGVSIR